MVVSNICVYKLRTRFLVEILSIERKLYAFFEVGLPPLPPPEIFLNSLFFCEMLNNCNHDIKRKNQMQYEQGWGSAPVM